MATGRIGTTPVLTVRWSKAPAAGTTSLSGLDDNSVSLVYSVGYEQVYRNGTLLSRGNDYTATNGTSITLIDATLAGDIIEVIANATVALTDTYTQSQANGKFINNTLTTTTGDIIYASAANTPARLGIGSTGQVLTVSGGVPTWGAAPASSFSGVSLTRNSNSTVSNTTWTKVSFDIEQVDVGGYHDNSTNNTRITIPTGQGGYYLVTANVLFSGNATGGRVMSVTKNNAAPGTSGTMSQECAGVAAAPNGISSQMVFNLAAGDYIELQVYQNSGGNLTLYSDANNSGEVNFSAIKLGI